MKQKNPKPQTAPYDRAETATQKVQDLKTPQTARYFLL
jgi:hypothetical protein